MFFGRLGIMNYVAKLISSIAALIAAVSLFWIAVSMSKISSWVGMNGFPVMIESP